MATMPGTMWPLWPAVPERRSQRLRQLAAPQRAACLAHPFVRGIASGSLPAAVFARWVVQDWHYLQTYLQVLGTLARTAPCAHARQRWGQMAVLTRDEELDLHRSFAQRFDIAPAQLAGAAVWPGTLAYSAFQVEQANRSYGRGVAALVPCGVGYVTLARALAAESAPADDRYADWIRMYSDPAFAQAVDWMESELDRVDEEEDALAVVYRNGVTWELRFWEHLWQGIPDEFNRG